MCVEKVKETVHTKHETFVSYLLKTFISYKRYERLSFCFVSYNFVNFCIISIFVYTIKTWTNICFHVRPSVFKCVLYFLKSCVSDSKLSFHFVLQNNIKLLYPKLFKNERRNISCNVNFCIYFYTKVSCLAHTLARVHTHMRTNKRTHTKSRHTNISHQG